jgi:methylthioribulose-1-phosphate dehydratase
VPAESKAPSHANAVRDLIATGRRFYSRDWVLGTSGNFSVVTSRKPLRLTITASGAHKGALKPAQFLQIDERGTPIGKTAGRPSAETQLHLEIVKARGAGAVLHTHSVWSTILSDRRGRAGDGFAIEGFEMLKGLDGVTTHEHREWIPIVKNDQDMPRLAKVVSGVLAAHPDAHAFLLERHGLYTWGRTLADAERHVEILEFLFHATAGLPVAPGSSPKP